MWFDLVAKFPLRQARSQPIEEPLHSDDALPGSCLEQFAGVRLRVVVTADGRHHTLSALEGGRDQVTRWVTEHAHRVSLQAG